MQWMEVCVILPEVRRQNFEREGKVINERLLFDEKKNLEGKKSVIYNTCVQ